MSPVESSPPVRSQGPEPDVLCGLVPSGVSVVASPTGAQLALTLDGFEACRTRDVVHADADVMVGRLDPRHDYRGDLVAAMIGKPGTLTVAFNIATDHERERLRGETPVIKPHAVGIKGWRIRSKP